MKRTFAIAWLIPTLLPLAFLLYMAFLYAPPQLNSPEEARAYSAVMFGLGAAVVIGGWLLVASYIVYVFKTRHVPSEKKALWAALLFFGNMFAMPIFWFLYVWRPSRSSHGAA